MEIPVESTEWLLLHYTRCMHVLNPGKQWLKKPSSTIQSLTFFSFKNMLI